MLANLMVRKHGFPSLRFENVGKKEFDFYVAAIQKAAEKDYSLITDFIRSVFPS